MRGRRIRALFAAALALAASGGAPALSADVDHYVLALSWSPTYCASRDPRDEPLQCALDADHTFIVHGLWPNTARSAPANCHTRARAPSRRTVDGMLDLMPDPGLVRYQWRKHGTCSNLSARDYFETVRRAAAAVTVPPGLATLRKAIKVRPEVLREAFLRANPGLPEDGIYIACRGEDLVDVRICLTPSLDFRDCPRVRNRRCRTPVLDVEPPR